MDLTIINKYCLTPRYFKVHYPEIYERAMKLNCKKFVEALYLVCGGTKGYCLTCGKPTKFINITDKYQPYCCTKCSNSSPIKKESISKTRDSKSEEDKQRTIAKYKATIANRTEEQKEAIKNKCKATCLEKYGRVCGVDISKSEETKLKRYGNIHYNNPQKRKKTCLERYGTEHVSQNPQVIEKRKKTCLERYGTPYYHANLPSPFGDPTVQQKIRQTMLERYGVEYAQQCQKIRQKTIATNMKKYGVPCNLMSLETKQQIMQTNIDRYGVPNPQQNTVVHQKGIQTCMKKYGAPYGFLNTEPGYSKSSQEYFDSLKAEHPNAVYATNGGEHKVGPYLLDWYDPDTNTAIEFNGDYWHANPKFYNPEWIHPVKKCSAKEIWDKDIEKMMYLMEQGIDVKVVWESEILESL